MLPISIRKGGSSTFVALALLPLLGGCGDSGDPAAPNGEDESAPPVASFTGDVSGGPTPLTVRFDATGSSAPDGEIVSYVWDFGDGTTGEGPAPVHTYEEPGHFIPTLEIRTGAGRRDWTVGSPVTATAPPGEGDGTIAGTVWHDRGGTGDRSAGDPGVAGAVVFLDENANGELDGGETYTVTDPDGSYAFEGVQTDRSYRVDQRLGLGWTNTYAGPPPDRTTAGVVGGTEAPEGEFPFMVALYRAGDSFFCGGTFIAARWVLTAAHCVDEESPVQRDPGQLELLVGTRDRARGGERVPVERILIYPAYGAESFAGNDLALVELQSSFMIPRIQLQDGAYPDASLPGTVATAAGWGRTARNDPDIPSVLRSVELEIISNPECERMLSESVVPSTICAGTLGGLESVCSGDSGGPLMVQRDPLWVQVGITSFGAFTCQPPMAFARVSELLDWVERQVPREASESVAVEASGWSTLEVDFGNFK